MPTKSPVSKGADQIQNQNNMFWEKYRTIIGQVERRDGSLVDFDFSKIVSAIYLAMKGADEGSEEEAIAVAHQVAGDIMRSVRKEVEYLPSIEDIQDRVERYLVLNDYVNTVKAYILYRDRHARVRREKHEELLKQFEERSLKVRKSDGKEQKFSVEKIEKAFNIAANGDSDECYFEDYLEAFKKNIVDDIQTKDIQRLMIKTAVDLITIENTKWERIAARLLLNSVYKQASKNRGVAIEKLYTPESYLSLFEDHVKRGLYYKDFFNYYSKEDIEKAGKHIRPEIDYTYGYPSVLSLSNRYTIKRNGHVMELPQEMYMSVALFLAIPEKDEDRLKFAFKLYDACAEQKISLPTPTLMNSRTNHHQLSSCFKLNIADDLRAIYHGIENIAQISKAGGGVGTYWGNVRAFGAKIRGVEKASGGVNPWIRVVNDTAIAVNQLGARLGAVSVTLDVFHPDVYDFLDLQTETGDYRRKAFDVFPAVSVPDLFMERVRDDAEWTLFDPHEVNEVYGKKLQDHFNDEFRAFYEELEGDERIKLKRKVSAKELFKRILKTTVETGMPYIFFRDIVNRYNPNSHAGNVYSTQLCTEICQNTSPSTFEEEKVDDEGNIVLRYKPGDTVVCNLASINVAKVNDEKTISEVFPVLARVLDNVITLNFYPIDESKLTAMKYRPVGIGYLGLAEYLAVNKVKYDSKEARQMTAKLFEKYGYHTYKASNELAKDRGHYELFPGSDYNNGVILGRDAKWYEENTDRGDDWKKLIEDIKKNGVRFGYHTAPAPNTSTAGIVGTTAALLPIYKKFYIENNLASPSVRVAPNINKENEEYYQEYISLDMKDVIDLIAEVYKWVDQSISFEWMINPAKTSPADLYSYYFRAWEKEIKTVYYVRSLSASVENVREEKGKGEPAKPVIEKPKYNVCESCSG